jgi:GNAT superfamily N-acetyltransferase
VPLLVPGPALPPDQVGAEAQRYRIRAAGRGDLETMREIERAAGRCFRDIGMPQVADDEPLPVDVLAEYQRAGRAWVAVDGTDHAVAYLISDLVDGNVHIEQMSVHPDHARRRLGRSLIDGVVAEAAAAGVPRLTLTTFRDVPWNAPYYARCGFHVLAESEWTPGLRAIRAHEAAQGMDRWPRICMQRGICMQRDLR